jgi:hypothetical protein
MCRVTELTPCRVTAFVNEVPRLVQYIGLGKCTNFIDMYYVLRRRWLRPYAISRRVAGSSRFEVIEIV